MAILGKNNFQTAAILAVAIVGLSMVTSFTGLGFGISDDVYRGEIGISEPSSEQFCSDSDEGLGGVTRVGTCRNFNGDFTDYCVSDSAVNEYFCQEYDCEANIVNCGPGNECRDGRCASAV